MFFPDGAAVALFWPLDVPTAFQTHKQDLFKALPAHPEVNGTFFTGR